MDKKEHWPISGINLAVARIEMLDSDKVLLATATGFFFREQGEKKYFITNRHVVIDEADGFYPKYLGLDLHNSTSDYGSCYRIRLKLYEDGVPLWNEHHDYKNNSADVVVIPLNDTTLTAENMRKFKASRVNFMGPENFPPQDTDFSSFSDVIIAGYPLGFYDHKNNLPVYRKGMIASSYPVDFNGKPYFLIDANLHAGTSGSPVLNAPRNTLTSPKGAYHTTATILLGVHSAEHVAQGEPLGLAVIWYPNMITDIINNIGNQKKVKSLSNPAKQS